MNTTKSKIDYITSHKADTDERIIRRMEIGKVVHQGDVYVHRVSDDWTHGDPWGSRQVAVGQQVGARHVAVGHVEVFSGDPANAAKVLPLFDEDQQRECLGPVVVAVATWRLEHPEHADHVLPAGTYQITYQWDEAMRARVVD